MKKVSIIVPVYNVEKYIAKCLDSLLNQTLSDIEVIVVNDGSPDNSQEIIDEYVKKYPSVIKSFVKENGGQGSARNYGLEKATGEYIGYVDSDDYVRSDMYEKMYNKAKKDNLDIVICGNYVVYEDSTKQKIELNNYLIDDKHDNAYFGKIGVCNKIYKKSLIEKIEFRSKKWYEDLDFTVKAISLATKIDYIDEALYYYLYRQGSTMNNSNVERNLEIIDAFDQVKDDYKNHDIIEFLAIDHIYISAIVRVINAKADRNTKKHVINVMKEYITINFRDFHCNKYLPLLSNNRKIILKLIDGNKYGLVKLIFMVKNVL